MADYGSALAARRDEPFVKRARIGCPPTHGALNCMNASDEYEVSQGRYQNSRVRLDGDGTCPPDLLPSAAKLHEKRRLLQKLLRRQDELNQEIQQTAKELLSVQDDLLAQQIERSHSIGDRSGTSKGVPLPAQPEVGSGPAGHTAAPGSGSPHSSGQDLCHHQYRSVAATPRSPVAHAMPRVHSVTGAFVPNGQGACNMTSDELFATLQHITNGGPPDEGQRSPSMKQGAAPFPLPMQPAARASPAPLEAPPAQATHQPNGNAMARKWPAPSQPQMLQPQFSAPCLHAPRLQAQGPPMHPSMQMQMPQGSRKGALGPRPMHPMPFTPQQQYAPMQYQVPRYQSVQQQHPSPFMQQAQAHGPLSGPQPPLAAPFDARHRPFVGSRSHSMPHAHHHHHHHHQQQMPQQQQLMPFAQGMPPPRPTLPTLGTPTQRFPAVPPMVPQVVPQMVPPTGSQTTTPRSQPIGVPHPLSGFAMVGQQEGSSLPPVGDEGVGELNSIHLSPDEFDAVLAAFETPGLEEAESNGHAA